MMIIGSMTLAIAAAFYYNFGAWGVGQTMGKTGAEIQIPATKTPGFTAGKSLKRVVK